LEWKKYASGFILSEGAKSIWACLPAGPLQRQLREGVQVGKFEKRSVQDLQEGVGTFLGRGDVSRRPLLVTCIDAGK
jgi:hypothetical protein